jgi:hypothetical protein
MCQLIVYQENYNLSLLLSQIEGTLPESMQVPDALKKLFQWIEDNGFYEDTEEGRIGYLFHIDKMRSEWTEDERPGGTLIEFYAEKDTELFHFSNEGTKDRLRIFARTGGDGSVAAFWLDENGKQQIVHIGSGSGSTLACVLSDEPVDFMRLIAIGYDEICWSEEFEHVPAINFKKNEFTVKPNLKFQNWLQHNFHTSIPKRALDIVKNPAEFGDENSDDPFCAWLEANDA